MVGGTLAFLCELRCDECIISAFMDPVKTVLEFSFFFSIISGQPTHMFVLERPLCELSEEPRPLAVV